MIGGREKEIGSAKAAVKEVLAFVYRVQCYECLEEYPLRLLLGKGWFVEESLGEGLIHLLSRYNYEVELIRAATAVAAVVATSVEVQKRNEWEDVRVACRVEDLTYMVKLLVVRLTIPLVEV